MFNKQNKEILRKMLEIRKNFPLDKNVKTLHEIGEEIFKRENLDHALTQDFLNTIKEALIKINRYERRKVYLIHAINSLYASVSSFERKLLGFRDNLGLYENTNGLVKEILPLVMGTSEMLECSIANGFHNEIQKQKKSFLKDLFARIFHINLKMF